MKKAASATDFSAKGILAFRAGALPVTGGEQKTLPERILICAWGVTKTNKGVVRCNANTLALVPRNAAATKRERVALDFQHNTVEGSPSYKGEPAMVAAYGNIEVISGEGIYLSALEWTPEGREHALGGHYPDISPAIKVNEDGDIIWVHSAGLVRQGEMDGLTLFSAGGAHDIAEAIAKHIDNPTDMKNTIDLINLFMAASGLPAIPADADLATVQRLTAEGAEKMGKTNKAAVDSITALAASTEGLTKKMEAMEKKRILDMATVAGKVVPFDAQTIEGMTVEIFAAAVEKLPTGEVPTKQRVQGKQEGSETVTFSASDREVMATLGLTEEQWKKHNA